MRFLSGNQRERTKGDSFPGNTIGQPERSQVTGARAGQSASHACPVAVLLTLVLLGVAAPIARAATIHVATTGSDGNDGLSWATAKQTVTAGLAAANSGDQVWVAAGTYVERITLKDGVALYGGFAGGETQLAERDWTANIAILDGNASGSVVTAPAVVSAEARIDGFVIRNGSASAGGGVYCSDSWITVENNTIKENTVTNFGAGIYCSNSIAKVAHNMIADNFAQRDGGGFYCYNCAPILEHNTLTNNRTWRQGGAVYCGSYTSPVISNNTIASNEASNNGGGIAASGSLPIIKDNTIAENSAASGGGIYYTVRSGSPTITNNTIVGNTATNQGGGIDCEGAGLFANNTVLRNSARDYAGGIKSGGGVRVISNTIMANTAILGGGLYGSSPMVANNIIAFNSSGVCSSSGTSAITLRNNCVYQPGGVNYDGVIAGMGDIEVDPHIVAVNYGQVHLTPGSVCVDAGYDDVEEPGWLDMDGNERIQGTHVDIGADEFDGTAPAPFAPTIVRVSSSGNDELDGATWGSAKRTVQAGIDAVTSAGGGEVWVAEGTYAECVEIKAWTYLYGGFAANEASRSQRDWRAHVTVLDGGAGGSVVSALAGSGLCGIDGFTIQNGTGRQPSSSALRYGGGICCENSLPTITNNIIKHNSLSSGYGGGVYCRCCAVVMANNSITTNSAGLLGGGVCSFYSATSIFNNVIAGNSTVGTGNNDSYGGGVYCNALTTITNNTIVGNNASQGGGITCGAGSVVNNIVAYNSAGIHVISGGPPTLYANCIYNPIGINYSGLAPGAADISVDPKLVAVNHGEVHLAEGSPCINTGNDAATQSDWVDMDGEARIQNAHIDIGADEFNGLAPAYAPAIIRVSPSGDDTNSGSTWELAMRSVQAGMDAAEIAGGGEVWVAAGTYNERIGLRPWVWVYGGFAGDEVSRSERSWVDHPTILDGGAGGSVVSALAGSGTCGADGFAIRNGIGTDDGGQRRGGGVYCVAALPTLSNNTITGNTADAGGVYCFYAAASILNNTISGNTGGGIYCLACSPAITNNTIVENSDSVGAGIKCLRASPTICNTIVAFNSSGIYSGSGGAPTLLHNCVYNPDGADYAGLSAGVADISVDPQLPALRFGQIHLHPSSPCIDAGLDSRVQVSWVDTDDDPRIQGAHVDIGADEFAGTTPIYAPVIVRVSPSGDDSNDGSTWELAKRTIQQGIEAAWSTGAEIWVATGTYNERVTLRPWVYIYGGFVGVETERASRNWRVYQTIVDGGGAGSVVSARHGHRVHGVDGCTLRNGSGTLTGSNRYGGGIYCKLSSPTISNCAIVGNLANYGGAAFCSSASPTILSTIIVGNLATGVCGGFDSGSGNPTLTNCVLSGNFAPSGAALYSGSAGSVQLVNCILWGNGEPAISNSYGTLTVTHSDVQGGISGAGNISINPAFLRSANPGGDGTWGTDDDDYGDLRLLAGSPCIDAGSNAAATAAGLLLDLDGHGRFYNDPATPDCPWAPGTCGTAPIVDMGAYEFIAGDYDRDGDLDLADLAIFQASTSGPSVGYLSDCLKADLDHDGDVDAADFGIFQRCYSGSDMPVAADCGN